MCDKCNQNKDNFKYCPDCGFFLGENDYHKSIPSETEESSHGDERIEKHPAYAQLSFSRRTSTKNSSDTLYGSAIRHQNTITMYVYPSKKYTSNYTERYFAERKPYIEVEMSESQFSEAITTLNIGSGVPVTLRSLKGEIIPKCQEETIQEKTQNDLNQQLSQLANSLTKYQKEIDDILTKKGNIKVADRKKLKNVYTHFIQEISSNLPFLSECMQEALDKNVAAAKSDVEAFFTNTINKLGLEKLEDMKTQNLIEDNN
jgi:hypothetical protein